jgi:hypothetical protein
MRRFFFTSLDFLELNGDDPRPERLDQSQGPTWDGWVADYSRIHEAITHTFPETSTHLTTKEHRQIGSMQLGEWRA